MVVEGDNLAIVMEYQHGGSVREFLQKQKNLLPGEPSALLSACFWRWNTRIVPGFCT